MINDCDMQTHRSRETELQQWCMAMGVPAPKYDMTVAEDGLSTATVLLPNGMRFQGSSTRRQEQAIESAASVALNSLVRALKFYSNM